MTILVFAAPGACILIFLFLLRAYLSCFGFDSSLLVCALVNQNHIPPRTRTHDGRRCCSCQDPDVSLSAPDITSGDVEVSLSAREITSGDVDASVSVPDMPSLLLLKTPQFRERNFNRNSCFTSLVGGILRSRACHTRLRPRNLDPADACRQCHPCSISS